MARSAARWAARVGSRRSELRAMNASPKRAGVGQAEPDDVRLDEGQAVLAGVAADAASRARVEHRRVEVDAGDPVAGLGQRDGQPAAADRKLEDRAAGPVGEGEVQVEVAGSSARSRS